MGSINAFEKSRLGGRPPGKINASLNEKLRTVKWGEYKIEDLFTSQNGDFDIQKKHINNKGEYVVTAGLSNSGILGKSDINAKIFKKNTITIDMFGNAFYRQFNYKMVTHARVFSLTPNFHITKRQGIFLANCFFYLSNKFGFDNMCSWEKIKTRTIWIPYKNNKINLDFMESFVAELEAQRVAELEAYLSVTGLKDTHLSFEEEQALLNFNKITFDEYKLTNVFDIKNAGNILSKDIVENSGKTPYLCASSENNAVSSYISYKDELKTKGNCIFIGGKTFVVTYQESDFFSNDSHNLALYLKEAEYRNKYTQMYLAACVNKSLNHKYTWGNSISNKKAQKDYISLPTKDGKIDFNSMSTLISAIHKLVIKDVVRYADEKIEKTKEAINSNTN